MKKTILVAALLATFTTAALAETCVANADAKKLAGAARTSFLGKCERDATTACEAQSAGKNLHGAAKTSFEGKCVKDAVGS
jgi:hypothetical protein